MCVRRLVPLTILLLITASGASAVSNVVGDVNRDGYTNQTDLDLLHACRTRPAVRLTNSACATADLDSDGDVDQSDFGILQACLSRIPVPAECNNPVRANSQTLTTEINTPLPITVTGSDAVSGSVQFRFLSFPSHGYIHGNVPSFNYVPNANYRGKDTIIFEAIGATTPSAPAVIDITVGAQQTNWSPPIGIPEPPFGIREQAPLRPNPWTYEIAGYYYVDYQVGSDNRPYGTPAMPRKTVPSVLAAGSVVEINGTYSYAPQGYQQITVSGTSDRPVYIRGNDPKNRPSWTRALLVSGTYCIVENIIFRDHDGVSQGSVWLLAPGDYLAVRNCDVSGNLNTGGGVRVVSWDSSTISNAVVWNNKIHDNGNWSNPAGDQDVHGIVVSANANNVWILDNEMYHNSGDGLQINAGSLAAQHTTHHVYVGRNVSHDNKQTGMWTKQAVDVIFSQNTCYNHRPSASSNGAGMGFQYDPHRVWFLYNHIYDCSYGISSGSGSGLGNGTQAYFVGNVIHDIHHDPAYPYTPGSAWAQAGIMMVGSYENYVINNTIHNVDAGINSPGGNLKLFLYNNIISNVTDPQGSHVYVEFANTAGNSDLNYSLFSQPGGSVRIKWASSTRSLAQFQAATGRGGQCRTGDPLFLDLGLGDLHCQLTSPAVNTGAVNSVYQTYQSLYGVSIERDADGTARPLSGAWDMGAYER